jgi:hypothetical protein
MIKIYLKSGISFDIKISEEDKKLTNKQFWAKNFTNNKKWYEAIKTDNKQVLIEMSEIAAIEETEEIKSQTINKKK